MNAVRERTLQPLSAFVFAAAVVKLGAHVLTASRYGYHRDELYFLAAADHPDWGYVDFPPATPMVALAVRTTLGDSLLALRLLPALAGVTVVILAGLLARELGAGRMGQNIAAVGVLGAPAVLGINSLLNTSAFDMLWWTLVLFIVTRLLRTREAKLWVAVGVAVGFGLLTKYTMLVLVASLAIAFLITEERRWTGTRWLWIGAVLALAIWIPNLLWQRREGWPTLEYLEHQETSATADSRLTFLAEQALNPGPLAFVLVVVGVVYLLRRRDVRVLGIAAVAVFAVFLLTEGKSYYTAALYPLAFAAAGVATERWVDARERPRTPRPIIAAVAVAALVPLPIAIPVLPKETVVERELYELRTDYADMFGWEELATSVSDVFNHLPARRRDNTAVLTRNYGEAGAIDFFGPDMGVPVAYSGHNGYYLWGPPPKGTDTVIAVGFERSALEPSCGSVRRAATLSNAEGVENFEYGRRVYVCRDLKLGVDELWRRVKRFTA